jgi:hypothetical protein
MTAGNNIQFKEMIEKLGIFDSGESFECTRI